LLHLVGLTFTYLSKMHSHSNIKLVKNLSAGRVVTVSLYQHAAVPQIIGT